MTDVSQVYTVLNIRTKKKKQSTAQDPAYGKKIKVLNRCPPMEMLRD